MPEIKLQDVLEKHRKWWKREDGPLLNVSQAKDSLFAPLHGISIPLSDGSILSEQGEPLTPEMIDPSAILDVEEYPLRTVERSDEGPLIEGDLMVTRAPLGKMVWVESTLGCPVIPRLDTGSIYSAPAINDVRDIDQLPGPWENGWMEVIEEYTGLLAEQANGQYQVVQCLERGVIDLASAVVGHEPMCMAMFDDPKGLQALNEFCLEAFIEVTKVQHDQYPELEGGYTNSFGIWSPGTTMRTQCDCASSVSAKQYKDFFFGYDRRAMAEFDYSVCHLHSGFLHHIDVVLEDEYPTAVQVSLDTGSTPNDMDVLIPIFKHALESKPLIVMGEMTEDELARLLDELPHNGLCIAPWPFGTTIKYVE